MVGVGQVKSFVIEDQTSIFQPLQNSFASLELLSSIIIIGIETGLIEKPESVREIETVLSTHDEESYKLLWIIELSSRQVERAQLRDKELQISSELRSEVRIDSAVFHFRER